MKTALITGASRGIGAACAAKFAKCGWRVIINYNASEAAAAALAAKITAEGGEAYTFRADIADAAECEKLVAFAERVGEGKIDALVNNAAIDLMGLFGDISPDEEKRLFDINLFGAMHCTRAALPAMIRAHDGAIVNISSIWGRVGASCEVHYSTSKAAVIGFTRSLAKEVAPSGIRVNCAAPGVIDTDMNKNLSPEDLAAFCEEVPMGRMGTPEEVAECVYFLANAGYVTGQVLGVDGGYI